MDNGCLFSSDTDSEVLAHLFSNMISRGLDPKRALEAVLTKIEGLIHL